MLDLCKSFRILIRLRAMAPVCHGLDGGGVFGRRHSGYLFKLPGKIVDGGVTESF